MAASPKVFISYARESIAHLDRVLAFADRLEELGVEVILDQYEVNPPQGWPKWMAHAIDTADFVASVCTAKYHERITEQQPAGEGLGVQWEGSIIYDFLYNFPAKRGKFQVVQFDQEQTHWIPEALLGNNRHIIKDFALTDLSFETLYRIITSQPGTPRPDRGEIVPLPRRGRSQIPRSGRDLPVQSIEMTSPLGLNPSDTPSPKTGQSRSNKVPKGQGSFLDRRIKQLVRQAREADANHDFFAAFNLWISAIAIDKPGASFHYEAGSTALVLGDFERVIYHCKKWLQFFPGDPFAQMCLIAANIKLGLQNLEQGLTEAALLLELDDSDSCRFAYGLILTDLEQFDLAEHFLKEVIASSESVKDRQKRLVAYTHVLWKNGKVQMTLELLENADKSYFDTILWLNLGIARAECGRFGLAIEAMNTGIRIGPKNLFAKYALAELYAMMNDPDTCIMHLSELIPKRSYTLKRIKIDSTFDTIRNSPQFVSFMENLESLGLT